jgi:hypothetical protein
MSPLPEVFLASTKILSSWLKIILYNGLALSVSFNYYKSLPKKTKPHRYKFHRCDGLLFLDIDLKKIKLAFSHKSYLNAKVTASISCPLFF